MAPCGRHEGSGNRLNWPAQKCPPQCAQSARAGQPVAIAIALALLLSVAAVLIAPSVDLPETVLREHHVASHSLANHTTGGATLIVAGSLLQAYFKAYEFPRPAVSLAQNHGYDKLSVVMRC